jgi:amino acid transporter
MISRRPSDLSPGEARTRQRQRRQIIFIGVAAIIGGVIGFLTGFFDQGDGNLFSNQWDKLSLDPAIAILLAGLLLFGFGFLPLYGFRTVDEMKREQNLIAYTGGLIAVLTGFPIWAVLHAGGMGNAPHPFGVWALGFVGMIFAYLYVRWRA